MRKVDRLELEPVRRRLGYTQQEIADRLGVHVRTWAKWIGRERACPWSVWLALQAMPAKGEEKGREKGKPRAGKKAKKGA